MNVFFDVDYTLIGSDGSVRPHTREVFEKLIADGHAVYIWSGVGDRTHDVERRGLGPLVTGIYQKPLANFDKGLVRYGVPVVPDFVIDDYQEIVSHFGGLFIKPYFDERYPDDELLSVLDLVSEMANKRAAEEPDA